MQSNNTNTTDLFNKEDPKFEIVDEEIAFKRYLCVQDRHVKFPNGSVVKWDVVGHSFNETSYYVCVFPYDSKKVWLSFSDFGDNSNLNHHLENSNDYKGIRSRNQHDDLWASLWTVISDIF